MLTRYSIRKQYINLSFSRFKSSFTWQVVDEISKESNVLTRRKAETLALFATKSDLKQFLEMEFASIEKYIFHSVQEQFLSDTLNLSHIPVFEISCVLQNETYMLAPERLYCSQASDNVYLAYKKV